MKMLRCLLKRTISSVSYTHLSYEDSYYESRDVSFTRASGKAVDIKGIHFSESTNAKGGNIKYDNFERKAALDDIYTLTCSVTDKAGNETTETATFYVNRFGSVYELTAGAKRLNREYVRSVNQDIVIKAVSYTHLDVYKRQLREICLIEKIR